MKRIGVLLVVGCVCFALLGGCGSSAGRPVRPVTDGFSCRIEAAYGDMTVAGTLTRPGGNALRLQFEQPALISEKAVLTFLQLPEFLLHHARKCIRLLLKKLCRPLYSLYIRL